MPIPLITDNRIHIPTKEEILQKPIEGKFTPSHAKRIHFKDGVVMELNRAQRRRNKLYNRNLTPIRKGR